MLFLPQYCEICHLVTHQSLALCNHCQRTLPLAHDSNDHLHAAFYYDTPIQEWIIQAKFHDQITYLEQLSQLLAKRLKAHYSDTTVTLIPIPLHKKRLRQRGYNQAKIITNTLSRTLQWPSCNNLLIRNKNTRAQSSLKKNQRLKNLKKAFSVTESAAIKHVVLIDDVITTGATILSAKHTLLQAGVKQVDCWAIAKTI